MTNPLEDAVTRILDAVTEIRDRIDRLAIAGPTTRLDTAESLPPLVVDLPAVRRLEQVERKVAELEQRTRTLESPAAPPEGATATTQPRGGSVVAVLDGNDNLMDVCRRTANGDVREWWSMETSEWWTWEDVRTAGHRVVVLYEPTVTRVPVPKLDDVMGMVALTESIEQRRRNGTGGTVAMVAALCDEAWRRR